MTNIPEATRKAVRARAGNRCEYCRKPSGVDYFPHHIDHIVAIKHGGSSGQDNLALACLDCNTFKGSDLTSVDPQTGAVERLFDPRSHQWEDHFRLEEAAIVGITATGRVTVRLLQMNETRQLEVRQQLIAKRMW